MPKPLRAAVVGCGRMGAYTRPELSARLPKCWLPLNHAEAVRVSDGVELVALCDVDETTVVDAAERHGVTATYTDYEKMIDEVAPDILCVATRTPGRIAIIEYAAAHGVRGMHVEKPLALHRNDARRGRAAIKNAGAAFTYGAIRRYMPIYQTARDIVASGELGRIRQVVVNMGPTYLLWSHPHSVDLMLFFAEGRRPLSASAHFVVKEGVTCDATMIDDDPVVASAYVAFDDGFSGVITDVGGLDTIIACERGNVVVLADGRSLRIEKPNATSGAYYLDVAHETVASEPPSGTAGAIKRLVSSINERRDENEPLEAAVVGVDILTAMGVSHLRGGAMTPLADVPDDFTVTGRMGELSA